MSQSAETTDQPRSSSSAVVYRHVTLIDGAELKVHEDRSVFVAMDDPPPIRTIVQLWRADQARAVLVSRVVEVPESDAGGKRGFYGIPADEEAIAAARRVGTEHLQSAGPEDQHSSAGEGASDTDPDANYNMAMPAPVVGDVEDEPEVAADAADDSDATPREDSAPRKRGRKKKR